MNRKLAGILPFIVICALAQDTVTIRVHPAQILGPVKPIWGYFGYDEPNYTYTANGKKLIGELGALNRTPVVIRTHNLLTTGDATPALKWGSTNAYTEDAAGKPVYDWTITDRIFDTYLAAHAKPFVEIGFMPEALSVHPEPYKHTWPNGGIDTGWAYPPKDYAKWGELVYAWARHCGERYGKAEAASWYWEVWNEPDIMYWHGTPDEYDKLYDTAVAAVKRALPGAPVGGPASTGPGGAHAAAFLRQFLEHCRRKSVPLDFISFHAKGAPAIVDGQVRMGIAHQLRDAEEGFKIVAEFPKFRALPIILSESDPEGCAACSAKDHPQNAYRNGTTYPAYTAEAMNRLLQVAEKQRVNLQGMLTWAFEFEDQPYFAGFRDLATNGVDKPILNFFRMAGLLTGDRVRAESSGALKLDDLVARGAEEHSDVDALAVHAEHSLGVLVWNYHDRDGAAASIALTIDRPAQMPARVLLRHYRIDDEHSNSYSRWQAVGSPQTPSPEQFRDLEQAAQLQLLESPQWLTAEGPALTIHFSLPKQAVSLLELSW